MQRNRQHAPDTGQRAAGNRTPILCRQRGKDNKRRAPGNKHATRQETTRQHAGLQQTTGNGQHATDNVHQTADGMQEDASTCEMQQETHGTAAFRVRRASGKRAAGNQQYARRIVRDNQFATRHRRLTQDATYARCRSMYQTHTEPTTRSRQCNVYEMRRTKSGRSRTSGHAAPAVVESD